MTILSVAALAFAINVLTSLVKNFVAPRFGTLGVQVFAFVLALIGALYFTYQGQFPALHTYLIAAGVVFSTAVAFYEVILSRIGWFSAGAFASQKTG